MSVGSPAELTPVTVAGLDEPEEVTAQLLAG
jgi:hypothetical protein